MRVVEVHPFSGSECRLCGRASEREAEAVVAQRMAECGLRYDNYRSKREPEVPIRGVTVSGLKDDHFVGSIHRNRGRADQYAEQWFDDKRFRVNRYDGEAWEAAKRDNNWTALIDACETCLATHAEVCPSCGDKKAREREKCPPCLRNTTAADLSGAAVQKMLSAATLSGAAVQAALSSVSGELAGIRQDMKRLEAATMAKATAAVERDDDDEIETAIAPRTKKEKMRSEMAEGLWRGGIETLVVEARNSLIGLLIGHLPDERQGTAREVLGECLSGPWGVPIVAALAGGAVLVATDHGVELPFVDPTIVERVGSEFRILAVHKTSREMLDRFVGPMRSTLGNLAQGIANLNAMGRATRKAPGRAAGADAAAGG